MVYSFAGVKVTGYWKHNCFPFNIVGIFHTLYTVQLSDKYENVLKEMRWNYSYLTLVTEDQYVVNYNKNSTHIYSVEMNVGMLNMHTFWPWPCQLFLNIYDARVASHSFYMYQIGDCSFHHNFCVVHFDLYCLS